LGAADFIVPTEDETAEKHVSVEEIRAKVRQVLSNRSYAESARRLGEKMRSYGGASDAASLIAAFAARV